jgi:2-methylcitrate dehydratase PrpD
LTLEDEPSAGAEARLAAHALGLDWRRVPEAARGAATLFLHDTLCVGVAGAATPGARAVLQVARAWGEGGACSVLGRPGVRLPAPSAAFVNAFQIHCQEFDCVHEPAVLHPMATVTAALLAEAERGGPVAGEAFLVSLIVGVDVAVALGLAATGPLTFFRPATAGVFGSVAALARLRGFSAETTLDAFGLALAFASGTMQSHLEGKPALPLQVANAARAAIVAADLAAAGLKGPHRSIAGPFGYLSLMERASDLAPVLEALSGTRRIAEVSWKPFPTGRAAHGGLVALRALMDRHGLSACGLDRLDFRAPPLIKRLVGRPARLGMDVAYARLCLPWLAATALTYGEVGLGDFTPERLADPGLHALAARIGVIEDGGSDPAAFTPLVAVARTRAGETFEVRIEAMLGAPSNPLSLARHMDKARRCLAHAGLAGAHDELWKAVATLGDAVDAGAALRVSENGAGSTMGCDR